MTDIKSIPSTLSPGTVLHGRNAQYCILQVLGQGSFGITYLARDMVGDDEVEQLFCIKEFFMRDINGRNDTSVTSSNREGMFMYYKRKFEQESDHLSQLRHRNIVMVTDAFRANGTSYYVMQYIDGQSLDQYITSRGRLSTVQAVDIARQVGDALQFMHLRGMVHLDVKPANVMMSSGGAAVLVDFGLSKQYDSDGNPESSTTVGTGSPGYAPIEQATHREGRGVPVQMDVYALGATVFKMLTGCRPPEAADVLNIGFPRGELQHCGVEKAVVDVVQKAMEPQCNKRYKTVEALVGALEAAVAAKPQKAQSTGSDEVTRVDAQVQGGKKNDNGNKQAGVMDTMSEKAGKTGTNIYAAVFTFVVVLVLSCLPDLVISGKGNTVLEIFVNKTFPECGNFVTMVYVIPALIGSVVVVLCEKRVLRFDSGDRARSHALRWFCISLLFNVAACYAVYRPKPDDTALASSIQVALAIVTTYLIQRWFKRNK